MTQDKQLPSSMDAERAVIGSCLMDRDAIIDLAPWLNPADFYLDKHRAVYDAILNCYTRKVPPDLQTVAEVLRQRDQLPGIGDIATLIEYSNSVPTSYHAVYYGRIVEQTAALRRLIQAGGRIAAMGYNEDPDITAEDAFGQAMLEMTKAAPRRSGDQGALAEVIVNTLLARMTEGRPPATDTGFVDFRKYLGGFYPSNLYVLAARPGVGKTALAIQIAALVARGPKGDIDPAQFTSNRRVDFVSLEMSSDELMNRWVAIATGIDSRRIRDYNPKSTWANDTLSDGELSRIIEAAGSIAQLPIFVDDSPGITLASIRNGVLQRIAADGPLALLVVDYLQLVAPANPREPRHEQVSNIARGLKNLSREINCPILALSQLSRAVEERAEKDGQLSDLRESGEIEQAADAVMFIYRDEMYNTESEYKGTAKISIKKNRHGPLGDVQLYYDPATGRWADLAREAYQTRPAESVVARTAGKFTRQPSIPRDSRASYGENTNNIGLAGPDEDPETGGFFDR